MAASTSKRFPSARPTRPCAPGSVRLFGKTHDVADLVRDARQQLIERLHAETQRQLGRGAELERILFVGGGAVALATTSRTGFPIRRLRRIPRLPTRAGCSST